MSANDIRFEYTSSLLKGPCEMTQRRTRSEETEGKNGETKEGKAHIENVSGGLFVSGGSSSGSGIDRIAHLQRAK